MMIKWCLVSYWTMWQSILARSLLLCCRLVQLPSGPPLTFLRKLQCCRKDWGLHKEGCHLVVWFEGITKRYWRLCRDVWLLGDNCSTCMLWWIGSFPCGGLLNCGCREGGAHLVNGYRGGIISWRMSWPRCLAPTLELALLHALISTSSVESHSGHLRTVQRQRK